MMVMATSSPGPSTHGAKDLATRFSDSLALRVKTMSLAAGRPFPSTAPRSSAICARTAAMASVASTDSEYRPRSGFAFMVS